MHYQYFRFQIIDFLLYMYSILLKLSNLLENFTDFRLNAIRVKVLPAMHYYRDTSVHLHLPGLMLKWGELRGTTLSWWLAPLTFFNSRVALGSHQHIPREGTKTLCKCGSLIVHAWAQVVYRARPPSLTCRKLLFFVFCFWGGVRERRLSLTPQLLGFTSSMWRDKKFV